jgi:phosphoglycerate kinase
MRKIQEVKNLKEKAVFVRCDFNVPIGQNGEILDDTRVARTIPLIEYLIKKGAKVILASHLGDPGGQFRKELSLEPLQDKLFEYLDVSIWKAPDCVGAKVKKAIESLKGGEVILLENLRFHPGEEANDLRFAKKLASLAEIYVNEAFGASHRAHASIATLPKLLPSFAGFLLQEEVKVLSQVLQNPKKPLVLVLGGKKAETKIPVIQNFLPKADFILVGGKLVKEGIPFSDKKLILANLIKSGYDISKGTITLFQKIIKKAKTIVWNGPMGFFEKKKYSLGTEAIAKAIANAEAFKIAGGGETLEAIKKFKLESKFNFLSTGGGAMLEFLAGKKLPGIEALK